MNAPRPRSRLRAFTLIELLTVIAIIGILAAIIIPTVGRVRESAHAATCLSNLRQIGTAVELYVNERGHYPPSVSGGSKTPDDGPAGRLWQQNLRPYMGATNIVNNGQAHMNSRLLLCPSRGLKSDTSDVNTSYAANPILMPNMQDEASTALKRAESVKNRSQTILMGDSSQQQATQRAHSNLWQIAGIFTAGPSQAEQPIPTPDIKDGDGIANFVYRHGSGSVTNVLFADGHVKAMRKGEILYRHLRNY